MRKYVRDIKGRFAKVPDTFDPRYWEITVVKINYICLSNRFDIGCYLDNVDYEWARVYLWTLTRSSKKPFKNYAKRDLRIDGVRATMFLHREIMMLKQPIPKYQSCILRVDHLDGDSLNNGRENLRWATETMNNNNMLGTDWKQPDLLGHDLDQICQKISETKKQPQKQKRIILPPQKQFKFDF